MAIPVIEASLFDGDCKTELGECPIWDDSTQEIMWVDIFGKRFFRKPFGPNNSSDPKTLSFDLPEMPGSFCICKDGRLIFAFERGPAYYNPIIGPSSFERIAPFEDDIPKSLNSAGNLVSTRLNDGRVDTYGRFVVGGYDQMPLLPEASPRSSIYRLDPTTMVLEKIFHGVSCANAICFTADGRTMYFTDSLATPRQIYRVSGYGVGEVVDKSDAFVTWSDEEEATGGLPDGSVLDSDGRLWSAQFGLGRVVRYDENGVIDFIITIPHCPYPTCLSFGGPDLRTIFITCCAFKLNQAERDASPEGYVGGLFIARLPDHMPAGLPECKFGV